MVIPRGCDLRYHFDPEMIPTDSTAPRFTAKTPFFLVSDGAAVSASIKTVAIDANTEVNLGVQYAAVRSDEPGTPTALSGTWISSAGTTGATATLSAGSQLLARLGYLTRRTTSTGEEFVEVGMDLAVHQCISLAGVRRFDLPPVLPQSTDITDAWVIQLADFMPTAGSPSFKAAVIGRDLRNPGSMKVSLVARTADDRAAPGGWATIGSVWDPSANDDEWNSGEVAPGSYTNEAWVQPGLAVRRTSTGSVIKGDFEIILASLK